MLADELKDLFGKLNAKLPRKFESEQRLAGLDVTSPIDGSVIGWIPAHDADDVADKVESATRAQKKWGRLTLRERSGFLEYFADVVKENNETLARIIAIDGGKPLVEARFEANYIVSTITTLTLAPALEAELAVEKRDKEYKEKYNISRDKKFAPVGVVGILAPFNFPAVIQWWTGAPALAAGNSIVVKPSEKTPFAALAIKALFDKAAQDYSRNNPDVKIPAGIFEVVTGAKDTGVAVVDNNSVGMLCATGSVGMCESIKEKSKSKTNPPILEGGGNNAIIISEKNEPENISRAVNATLKFMNGGVKCTNPRRIFVHRSEMGNIVEELQKGQAKFIETGKIKNPLEDGSLYAPCIDELAANDLTGTIIKAICEGHKVIGGERIMHNEYPDAHYYTPAIVVANEHTKMMEKECFGPLIYVVPYDEISKAIELVNAPYNAGLVHAIYSQDKAEIELFKDNAQAGHAVVNMDNGTGNPPYGMGFGGLRGSGSGRVLNSEENILAAYQTNSPRAIAQNDNVHTRNWVEGVKANKNTSQEKGA